MSIFKSIGSAIGGIARAIGPVGGAIIGGPVGGLAISALGSLGARSPSAATIASPLTTGGRMPAMGALPQIGRALPMLGAAGGLVVAGGRAVARSAMTYCRRHPNWCSTIGGTAAVAALIESGQLPTIRHRRGRGITPKDLRSFRRVANLVRGFCPTVRRIPTRSLHVRRTGISHA